MQTEELCFMTQLLDITQFAVFLEGWGIMREKVKQIYECKAANVQMNSKLKLGSLYKFFTPKGHQHTLFIKCEYKSFNRILKFTSLIQNPLKMSTVQWTQNTMDKSITAQESMYFMYMEGMGESSCLNKSLDSPKQEEHLVFNRQVKKCPNF